MTENHATDNRAAAQHDDAEQLYLYVGKALSRWNLIENSLGSLLFYAIVDDPDDIAGPTLSAYWAVVSMEARLKMVDAALRQSFIMAPELLKEWGALHKKISDRISSRIEIAHGTVIRLYKSEENRIPYLIPHFFKQQVVIFSNKITNIHRVFCFLHGKHHITINRIFLFFF